MTMHTRHWIFGIGLPIMGAAVAALYGVATPDEATAAQASQTQFGLWIAMAIQLAIGVADWIKNNGKQVPAAVAETEIRTKVEGPGTTT